MLCCMPPGIFNEDGPDQHLQRHQFPFLNQIKLQRTKDKVLETRIQMAHGPGAFHVRDVRQVDVGVHAK